MNRPAGVALFDFGLPYPSRPSIMKRLSIPGATCAVRGSAWKRNTAQVEGVSMPAGYVAHGWRRTADGGRRTADASSVYQRAPFAGA